MKHTYCQWQKITIKEDTIHLVLLKKCEELLQQDQECTKIYGIDQNFNLICFDSLFLAHKQKPTLIFNVFKFIFMT